MRSFPFHPCSLHMPYIIIHAEYKRCTLYFHFFISHFCNPVSLISPVICCYYHYHYHKSTVLFRTNNISQLCPSSLLSQLICTLDHYYHEGYGVNLRLYQPTTNFRSWTCTIKLCLLYHLHYSRFINHWYLYFRYLQIYKYNIYVLDSVTNVSKSTDRHHLGAKGGVWAGGGGLPFHYI